MVLLKCPTDQQIHYTTSNKLQYNTVKYSNKDIFQENKRLKNNPKRMQRVMT